VAIPRRGRLLEAGLVWLESSLVVLAFASAFFWWGQHSARQQNAALTAEILKLRRRLQALRD